MNRAGGLAASRPWGLIDADAGRYGARHVRLRIFPPDITTRGRRIWRGLHVWPAAGFVVAVVVGIALTPLAGVETAIFLGIGVWLVPLVSLWLLASPLTGRIREIWTNDHHDGSHDEAWARFDALACALADADRALAAGEIGPAQYRARWRAAYDGSRRAAPARPVAPARTSEDATHVG